MAITRATLLARLAEREDQLELANATYSALLEQKVHSYTLRSADGEQETIRRKLREIRIEIEWLEAEINKLNAQINGGGVMRLVPSRWS